MTELTQPSKFQGKPIVLRAVFIMSLLKAFLAIGIYFFVAKNSADPIIEPVLVLYTGLAYFISFALLVFSILTKRFLMFRAVMVLDVLVSLPAKAYIGIVFAIISLLLSLHPKIKNFFERK